LKSNAAIVSSNKLNGVAPVRVPDATTLRILANENISGPMPLDKVVRYGDVTGSVQSSTVFKYGGAKKATAKKATAKKATAKKATAKKATAKKATAKK
jgi:hypothetical protein